MHDPILIPGISLQSYPQASVYYRDYHGADMPTSKSIAQVSQTLQASIIDSNKDEICL